MAFYGAELCPAAAAATLDELEARCRVRVGTAGARLRCEPTAVAAPAMARARAAAAVTRGFGLTGAVSATGALFFVTPVLALGICRRGAPSAVLVSCIQHTLNTEQREQ